MVKVKMGLTGWKKGLGSSKKVERLEKVLKRWERLRKWGKGFQSQLCLGDQHPRVIHVGNAKRG